MSDWISVEERLPYVGPVAGRFACSLSDVCVAWRSGEAQTTVGLRRWRNGLLHWVDADRCAPLPWLPTHWMPLPEPPKPQETP